MPIFIVKTEESVAGTYRVEAETEEEARLKFGDPKIDWSKVEQTDYMAYACCVQSVDGPYHPKPDPQCSGPGFAHAPHGNCMGYGTDRT